ncbi:Ig-like domain-containing protein [Desulfuromonas thiophila]|uniref:Metallo-peptidase family M12B Reprolysin-like n=1 Tax=Desulfuromonas thiophila TaxID=57664 RepID=A0A1G7EWK9_9BACT|nr:cadherin-like domain-containing protein [Desulfuromonas thiophila]SDE67816.1 Metallo-peptidase family M12B Reprolysin-like [Desulfuromonas thiophila]
MAFLTEIEETPLSGLQHVDALLMPGPDWNYLTEDGSTFRTTLTYSFSISSGIEGDKSELRAFSEQQMGAVRSILDDIRQITGISFTETDAGTNADLHFAAAQLSLDLAGLCSYQSSYGYQADQLTSYEADAWVYLNHAVSSYTTEPVGGSATWETLLHEIGHALGLKHPFETSGDNSTVLSAPYTDDKAYTLMSYTRETAGEYYSTYNEYDLAALTYLYGVDGLRGNWGIATDGTYLVGCSLDEIFELPAGYVALADQGGEDRVVYQEGSATYVLETSEDWLIIKNAEAVHFIDNSIEYIQFSDTLMSYDEAYSIAQNSDNQAPQAQDDDASVSADTLITLDVLENDSDADDDELSVAIITTASHGTAVINTDKTITYRPEIYYSGTDQIVYEINDGKGGTDQATVNITISPAESTVPGGLNQTEVSQLYVAIYGRASEGSGNRFWQQATEKTAAAAAMLDSQPSIDYFGEALNSDFAFISHIYENTLGKTAEEDPEGVNFWVGALTGAAPFDRNYSREEVIVSLIDAAMDPQYRGLAAQERFVNKVAASNYCANNIEQATVTQIDTFIGYIAEVTNDPSTLYQAQQSIDSAADPESATAGEQTATLNSVLYLQDWA